MKRAVIAFAAAALGVWLLATPASARDCNSCSGSAYYDYDEYDYPALGVGCCGPSERYTRRRHRDASGYRRNRRASDVDDGNDRREGRRSNRRDRDERERDDDD